MEKPAFEKLDAPMQDASTADRRQQSTPSAPTGRKWVLITD